MARELYPKYPPEISEEEEQYLVNEIKDWSIAHGLAVRPPPSYVSQDVDPNMHLAVTAPVTLFPSPFPRRCFEEALSVQPLYNELYAGIAMDEEWLGKVVEELAGVDDFIARLWDVHLAVKKEGYAQDLSLGLFRSDYMVHIDPERQYSTPTIRQVEFNTIASSFGGLASRISNMHKYLLNSKAYSSDFRDIASADPLPENESIKGLSQGLRDADRAYGAPKTHHSKCILFLVQDIERNTFDQRHLEYDLVDSNDTVFRLPFSRVLIDTKVDATTRALVYKSPASAIESFEVSVIYLRAGYSPSEYDEFRSSTSSLSDHHTTTAGNAKEAWKARLHLERSAAIKCPSILTHLAGCKKVQQILATPSSRHLSRFTRSERDANRIKATFAPIYPMDNSEEGNYARELALNPERAKKFVLKPQREGGGNNIYRERIPEFLKSQDETRWAQFILMEMIETPTQHNMILRNGEVMKGGVICELGSYGACLWRHDRGTDRKEILNNHQAGYLLRTKGDTSEEGGVAAGFGAVDSCCLFNV